MSTDEHSPKGKGQRSGKGPALLGRFLRWIRTQDDD